MFYLLFLFLHLPCQFLHALPVPLFPAVLPVSSDVPPGSTEFLEYMDKGVYAALGSLLRDVIVSLTDLDVSDLIRDVRATHDLSTSARNFHHMRSLIVRVQRTFRKNRKSAAIAGLVAKRVSLQSLLSDFYYLFQ